MKINFSLVVVIFFCIVAACKSEAPKSNTSDSTLEKVSPAVLKFEREINDLGEITEGEKVLAWFGYTNQGEQPLIIKNIKAGCGCTIPQWKREPLQKGEKGEIKIYFDSNGKKGIQNILIRVYSNASKEEKQLRIRATVTNN